MSKKPSDELASFVADHPTTAVADLLGVLTDRGELSTVMDQDVIFAYLQRVAHCDALPESIRSIARQLTHEWDLESVSASAAALFSLSSLLH